MLVLDGEPQLGSIAFTAGGSRLVAVRDSRRVEIWSPLGERLCTLGPFPPSQTVPISVAAPPRGPLVFVAAHGPPAAFAAADGQLVGTAVTPAAPQHIAVAPDGSWLVATAGTPFIWRLYGFRCTAKGEFASAWEERLEDHETPCAFVGAGDRFVTLRGQWRVVRDTATGRVQRSFPVPVSTLADDAVSPDGKWFALGHSSLYKWDTAAWGDPVQVRADGSRSFRSFAFHPTRPLLATVQEGQAQVKFLDANTGRPLAKFQWKLGALRSVCFSPDGTLAAASSASGKIVVWDVD
jgi:WD40 repeat protein